MYIYISRWFVNSSSNDSQSRVFLGFVCEVQKQVPSNGLLPQNTGKIRVQVAYFHTEPGGSYFWSEKD